MNHNSHCRSRVYLLHKWQDTNSSDDDGSTYHFSLKEIWRDDIGLERPQLAEEATITTPPKPATAFIVRTWASPSRDATTQYRVQIEHIPTGTRKFLADVNMLWHFIAGYADIDTYENSSAISTPNTSQ